MDEYNAIQDEAVSHFAKSAQEFCSLLEKSASISDKEFVQQAAYLLATLYAAGLSLPTLDNGPEEQQASIEDTSFEHTSEIQRQTKDEIERQIGRKLGKHNLYWEFFDPYDQSSPLTNTLSDDLSDIYGDIKRGLIAYQKGTARSVSAAVWEWKDQFNFHWGDHAVDALRAIHRIVSPYLNDEL